MILDGCERDLLKYQRSLIERSDNEDMKKTLLHLSDTLNGAPDII